MRRASRCRTGRGLGESSCGSGACCWPSTRATDRVYAGTFDHSVRLRRRRDLAREPGARPTSACWRSRLARRPSPTPAPSPRTSTGPTTGSDVGARARCASCPASRGVVPGRPWLHHVLRSRTGRRRDAAGRVERPAASCARPTAVRPGPTTTRRRATRAAGHPPARADRVYEAAGRRGAPRTPATWTRGGGLDRGYAWATAVDRDDPDLWCVWSPALPPWQGDGGAGDAARSGSWSRPGLGRSRPRGHALAPCPTAPARWWRGCAAGRCWSARTRGRPGPGWIWGSRMWWHSRPSRVTIV